MDKEMIERVAKEIGDNLYGYVDEKDTPNTWATSIGLAVVAIKAMREPTEKMVEAGRKAVLDCYSLEPGEGFDDPPAPFAWKAMIDSVLND